MRFLSRLDDFEHIVIDGSVSSSGLSTIYLKDTSTPILRIGNNTGDSFITYDGSELSVSSDVDLRLTTPTDQDVFLITSSGNILTTGGGGNFTIGGGLTLSNFGAGYLKTDANGIVSVGTDSYISNVSFSGSSLTFTSTGDAFSGSIDLSGLNSTVRTVYETVKNVSGATIQKGTPLAVVTGQTSGNVSDVIPADAADPAKMPAVFIANENIADEAEGEAVLFGNLTGVNTALYPSGTTVYVAPGGGWTATKPVWPNLIQNLGVITKQHATNGAGIVTGVGRANALPNLTAGKIWVGSANYPVESTTVHVDDVNNRVGIGTSQPSTNLNVVVDPNGGNPHTYSRIHLKGGTYASMSIGSPTNGSAWYMFGDTDDAYVAGMAYEHAVDAMYFNVNNSTALYINSSRNVGIGTTAPTSKLFVLGSGTYNTSTSEILASDATIFSSEMSNDSYNSILQLVSVRQSLTTGSASNGFLGFSTIDDSNAQGVRDAGRIAIVNEVGSSRNSATALSFWTNSGGTNTTAATEKVRITSAGNVGIGTTSPTHKLHVVGSVNIEDDLTFGIGGFLGTSTSVFEMFSLGDIIYNADSNNNGDSNHIFRESGNELMRITSAGNVGIGITSPLALLDIAKTTGASLLIRNGDDSIGSNNRVQIRFSFNGTNNYSHFITSRHNSGAVDGNALDFYVGDTTSGGTYPTNAIHNLTLNGGKVGIGTTAPDRPLHIYTSSVDSNAQIILQNDAVKYYIGPAGTDSDNFNIYYDNGSRTAFSIQSDGDTILVPSAGNVGIGTTSPIAKLHLSDTTGGSIYMQDSDGATTHNISSISNNGNNFGIYTRSSNGTYVATDYQAVKNSSGTDYHRWFTNGDNERMRITSAGNVGIGTTSPGYKLDVTGDINFTSTLKFGGVNVIHGTFADIYANIRVIRNASTSVSDGMYIGYDNSGGASGHLRFFANGTNERMRIDASTGNVGIGTSSPGHKLDVAGSININNTSYAYKINSLNVLSASATYTNLHHPEGGVAIYLGDSADRTNYYDNSAHRFRNAGGVSDYMVINSSGSVGIGTTSPAEKLHVQGNIIAPVEVARVSLGIQGGAGDVHFGASGLGGPSVGSQDYGFYAAHNAYRISTGAWKHSRTSTIPAVRYLGSAGVSGGTSGFYWDYSANVGTGDITWTNLMRLDTSGNLGIGTTSPSDKLHIKGNLRVEDGSTASNFRLQFADENTLDFVIEPSDDTNPNVFRFRANSQNAAAGLRVLDRYEDDYISLRHDGAVGVIETDSDGGNIYISPQGSVAITATISGNVGIGTTSPQAKLDVAGAISTGNGSTTRSEISSPVGSGNASLLFAANAGNVNTSTAEFIWTNSLNGSATRNELMRITSGGNVGIGTTSPDVYSFGGGKILTVSSTSTYSVLVLASGNANSGGISMGNQTIRRAAIDHLDGSHLAFYTNGTNSGTTVSERMRVTSAGNVGIGTTAPASLLHLKNNFSNGVAITYDRTDNANVDSLFYTGVSTNGATTSDFMWMGVSTSSLVITDSANVGIGNTLPSQKLHVSGNVRVTGAYYDSNNEAGTSGQVLTSTGTGTDWKSLAEITGVDGTGTANYVAKWSDADTITNSQIQDNGTTVGIGVAPASAKLTVNGSITAAGQTSYGKSYGSLDTTGVAVAGLNSSSNGQSALFTFTCYGGDNHYQRVVYSCKNDSGIWIASKVVDEGTNGLDVTASANGATITFTYKSRSGTQGYSPRVLIEHLGSAFNTSYL